jgi:hypothetical protein
LASEYYFNNIPKGNLLPNTCFYGFGLGALLAWVLIFKNDFKEKFYKLAFMFGILASFIFLVLILWFKMPINIPGRFLTFIISIWILSYVVVNAENKTIYSNTIDLNIPLPDTDKGTYLCNAISDVPENFLTRPKNIDSYDDVDETTLSGFFAFFINSVSLKY